MKFVLFQDNITYLVIYCKNLENAFKRLPTAQGYVIEYLVRFVARLQPLTRSQVIIDIKLIHSYSMNHALFILAIHYSM